MTSSGRVSEENNEKKTKGAHFSPKRTIPWTSSRPSHDCCRSSFFNFFIFYFSLHSLLDGGIWFQTVEFGSVLECDWKMRFIVPKNHPERKRTSILVEWGRKKLKLIDFLSQSWSAQTNVVGCAHPFGSVASDAQNFGAYED